MLRLRKFMFESVYLGAEARSEHDRVHRTLRGLFDHYLEAPSRCPAATGRRRLQRVTDYIAGMTDRYAIATFRRVALPEESRLSRASGCHGAVHARRASSGSRRRRTSSR